jgi:hypothetical protein
MFEQKHYNFYKSLIERKVQMKKQTRRSFLVKTSLSTAVLTTVAGLGVVPGTLEASAAGLSSDDRPATRPSPAEMSGPLVAYVRDLKAGEVSILVGSQEIIYRDPEFVQRLLRALAV